MIYSLKKKFTKLQLDKKQIIIKKVVNIIKNKEIPSKPKT